RFVPPPRHVVLPPIGPHLRDAPEAPALNEIHGVAEVAPTPLLHAALQYLFAGAHRIRKCRALLDGVGDRLFKVDVFAGGYGVDGHAHMPMVGRGDNDSVQLLLKKFAIIRVDGRYALRSFFYRIASRPIDVAHSGDLVVAGLVGSIK